MRNTLFILLMAALAFGCTTKPQQAPSAGLIIREQAALDVLIPKDAVIEKLCSGLRFTEGPLWAPGGFLIFSDIPANRLYRWKEGETCTGFMDNSGLDAGIPYQEGKEVGSNGIAFDPDGRLLLCQHGNRQLVRVEDDGRRSVLAARFRGKRLNSPNDLAVRRNGDIYFTDPPYGLPTQSDTDSLKELPFNGVYRLVAESGELQLLDSTLTRPNGITFSPDERYAYVAVSDPAHKVWYRYTVQTDGSFGEKTLFYDATTRTEAGLPDGLKVDAAGRIWATGPGGVWVFTPEAAVLGRISPAETPANCAFGADGYLYMTARQGLYRVRLSL